MERQLAGSDWTGLGRVNGQLCMRLWDPKARAEVLILFPGSGNASGGQGPHERETHFVARPEQSSAEPGLGQARGQARCNCAHIKRIHLVSNNIIPHVRKEPDTA